MSLDAILGGGFVAVLSGVLGLVFKYRDHLRKTKSADEETTIGRLLAENKRASKRADEAEADAERYRVKRDQDVQRIRDERDRQADLGSAYRGILIEKGYTEIADAAREQLRSEQMVPRAIRARRNDDG